MNMPLDADRRTVFLAREFGNLHDKIILKSILHEGLLSPQNDNPDEP